MIGSQTTLFKTLSGADLCNSRLPENFQEALTELSAFCEQQLPSVLKIVFSPTCFDVTQNERFAVLGGEHGNLANFDLANGKIIRDEEICYESSVKSVILVADDTQVVLANTSNEVYILEFPTLDVLYKFQLSLGPIRMIFSKVNQKLYLANNSTELKVVQLSKEEDFYTNFFALNPIQQKKVVCCLGMNEEGYFMALGFDDGSIGLFHLETATIINETAPEDKPANLIVFSKRNLMMAAAFGNNQVVIWNIDSELSEKYRDFNHKDVVTGLAFVRENKYLVSGCMDNYIRAWDTEVDSSQFTMNLNELPIVMLKSGRSNKCVYYIHDNNEMQVWRVPLISQNACYKHKADIVKVMFKPSSFELISLSEDGEMNIWDFSTHLLQSSYNFDSQIRDAKFINEGKTILISTEDPPTMRLFDLSERTEEIFELSFVPVAFEVSSTEALIAISDRYSRVLLHDFDVMLRKLYFKGHLKEVTSCVFIEEDKYLLTASRDTTLGKWDVSNGKRIGKMEGHKTAVLNMLVSDQGYILSASEDGNVIIWSIDCFFLYILVPPEAEPNTGLYLSSTHNYLITVQSTKVNYWQLQSLSLIFQTDTVLQAKCISLTSDELHIAVAQGNSIYIEENAIECTTLRIVGKNLGSPHKFMKFILDCQIDSSKAQYDMEHNHWMIAPYLLGPAHILSYCNRFNDLDKALFHPQNRAHFFSSVKNENPLTICVEMEFKNCIDICLKYMKIETQERDGKPKNPRAYVPLESCLTKLNTIEYPYISKLYDSLFITNTDSYLPRFCLIEANLPSTYLSERFTLYPENLIEMDKFSNTGRPVVFSQSTFPLDLDLGTYGSIKFLQSLLDCSDSTVFRSNIVKEYLECKWVKIRPASYLLGAIYITYLIMLAFHIVVLLESKTFLAAMILVHIIMVLYEILQVATDFGDYWKSAWNILDQLRSISFSFYAIMAWKGEYNTDILLAVLIFSWTRGISCFRMFDNTRYMVRLIIQVIIDITTFFFILFYATLAFAFIYYMRNPEKSFAMYLTVAYRLDLGDFETNFTSYFDWGLFFAATMINPLIMLNLLIAIMSDTATLVDEIDDICGRRELTEMIIDIEKVMFWKKHLQHKHYLHKLDYFQVNDEETDKTMAKIRFIKRQVKIMDRSIKSIKQTTSNIMKTQFEDNLKVITQKQDEIRDEVKELFDHNDELLHGISERLKIKPY